MKNLLGLIGYPLNHSFSPDYFKQKFVEMHLQNWEYRSFPLEKISYLPSLLDDHPDLVGLNVTIPYKEVVIPFLDELDDGARTIGAVNTLHIKPEGIFGYNTDAPALQKVLLEAGAEEGMNALILGTGGSAKTAAYVLTQMGIYGQMVSRRSGNGFLGYEDITPHLLKNQQLLIQATPVGMLPNVDELPTIPYEALNEHHILIDLIYNPLMTKFLEEGKKHGANIFNGLRMLYLQADLSWQIWTNIRYDT